MTDDSCQHRVSSHARLEPKLERNQDGLHIRIPYLPLTPLWGSSFRRPLGWTLSNPFSLANIFLVGKKPEVRKIEGERDVQQACCCCCLCGKYVHLLIVAAAQFGAYAVYVCAIQQQFIDA